LFDRSLDEKKGDHGLPLHLQLLMLRPETPYLSNAFPPAIAPRVTQVYATNARRERNRYYRSTRDLIGYYFCLRRIQSSYPSTDELEQIRNECAPGMSKMLTNFTCSHVSMAIDHLCLCSIRKYRQKNAFHYRIHRYSIGVPQYQQALTQALESAHKMPQRIARR
jgi:hypothetical protein